MKAYRAALELDPRNVFYNALVTPTMAERKGKAMMLTEKGSRMGRMTLRAFQLGELYL
jgi:hypothetical protein